MTSELKCPVCQQDLRKLFNRYTGEPNCDYECGNFNCELYGIEIPESVWKAVIQKLEDLKIAKKALEDIASGQIIEHSVFGHESDNKIAIARNALEQIEHKE